MDKKAWDLWQMVRKQNPLVQCITNFVSMDIMANVLLAGGASPAMAHSAQEVEDFVKIASALLVNVGTLTSDWTDGMMLAGAGATPYRSKVIQDLIKVGPSVIRGNASEIMAAAGAAGAGRGVDSSAAVLEAVESSKQLARQASCVVAISGSTDMVTDGTKTLAVQNGHQMMTLITAAGCSVTALVAAFVSACPEDALFATAAALSVFGQPLLPDDGAVLWEAGR